MRGEICIMSKYEVWKCVYDYGILLEVVVTCYDVMRPLKRSVFIMWINCGMHKVVAYVL